MTQNQLNQRVADATGEDIADIQQRGFSLADPLEVTFDPEPCDLPPQVVDWDEVDLQHNVAIVPQR
jgi:hypothetical protein